MVKFARRSKNLNHNQNGQQSCHLQSEAAWGRNKGGEKRANSASHRGFSDLFSFSRRAGGSRGQGLSCSLPDPHCACIVSCTQQALNKHLFNDGAELQMKPIHAESSVSPGGEAAVGRRVE